jgi:circadian clock protein KaiC
MPKKNLSAKKKTKKKKDTDIVKKQKKTNNSKKRQVSKNITKKPVTKKRKNKNNRKKVQENKKRITFFSSNSKLKTNKKVSKKDKKEDKLHIETIQKVDNLIKKMEFRREKNAKKQGFFKNILNWGQPNQAELQLPEFLTTPPFPEYTINWDDKGKIENLFNNNDNGFLGDAEELETKMTEIGDNVLIHDDEEFSKIDTTENFDDPLIPKMGFSDDDLPRKKSKKKGKDKWLFTSIPGFDDLLVKGIPTGSNIIVAGGPGCGKTIFCLQTIYNKALEGKDCIFLSMEERPERLRDHMLEFGFKVKEIERSENHIILKVNGKGRISLKRLQPIRLARSIEALLEKASGTLPVNIDMVLDFIPEGFDPYLLTLDSISAIETAFSGTNRQYRIYIEQLFRYFEHLNVTTFMITESSDAPKKFSNTSVEEFLADGIIVFYIFQGIKERTRGAEIYKLRGAPHSQKIVPLVITSKGLSFNPKEVCSDQATNG